MVNCFKLGTVYLLCVCIFEIATAQQIKRCGTAEYVKSLLENNPHLHESAAKWEQRYLESNYSSNQRGAVITIPVVVHIVHDGDIIGFDENISDAQVFSQIEVLNEDFRRLNDDASNTPAQFQSIAADFEIEFCMASRDPDGKPTTGINRINGGRVFWTETTADAFKKTTIWDPTQYLNIWVLRLGGTNLTTLGYSSLPPFSFDSETDGVVVDYTAFGRGEGWDLQSGAELGRTATHEVGHWLGLWHIWGDDNGECPSDTDGRDDKVADTPEQGDKYTGCPEWPMVSCGSNDMFMNFMDYSNDECSNLFTEGQKALAQFTLNQYRSGIANSQGCDPVSALINDVELIELLYPTPQMCTEIFQPVIRVRNMGTATVTSISFNYGIDNGTLEQHEWTGSMAYSEIMDIRLPVQNLALGQHSVEVYLGNFDENNGNNEVGRVFNINGTGFGEALPIFEDFESGIFPPINWQSEKFNGNREWEETTEASFSGFSCISFDNYTGTDGNNPRGIIGNLITTEMDFHDHLNPHLIFNVAYARRDKSSKDSLKVYYSVDCGNTWNKVYAKGNALLATADDISTKFIPDDNEWREEALNFEYLSGYPKVMFKFENESDWGNVVYIDDIEIGDGIVGIARPETIGSGIMVYPNPCTKKFKVSGLKFKVGQSYELRLYDVLGSNVLTSQLENGQGEVDVNGLDGGVYIYTIQESVIKMRQTGKITVIE